MGASVHLCQLHLGISDRRAVVTGVCVGLKYKFQIAGIGGLNSGNDLGQAIKTLFRARFTDKNDAFWGGALHGERGCLRCGVRCQNGQGTHADREIKAKGCVMRLKTGGLNVDQQILAQQPLVTQAFQHLQRFDALQAFALNDLWRAIDQRMDAWALVGRDTQQVLQQRHDAWRAEGMNIKHCVLRGG